MKSLLGLSLAACALGLTDLVVAPRRLAPTQHAKGWGPSGRGFDPRINRNTGRPHEHAREIARFERRQARPA